MTIFERCALALLGTLVIGLVATAVRVPLDVKTTAPQATFQYAWSAPIPAQTAGEPAAVPANGPAKPRLTVKTVASTFAEMGYTLDSVLDDQDPVPRIILASMPAGLGDVPEVKVRKTLFFQTVLPLVLKVNEEIMRDRKRLWRIRAAKALGHKLDPIDRLWLAVMADRYRVRRGDLDALLQRVDVVPPSIALAQAAEESGWGTSRFSREGNAIFGQWTFSSSNGLKPREREEGQTHRVRAFDNLLDSARAYALNLNTHRAYRDFRRTRSTLRLEGQPLSGQRLLPTLTSYSQRGQAYVQALRQIIAANDLLRADDTRLQDRDDTGLRVAGESATKGANRVVGSDETI